MRWAVTRPRLLAGGRSGPQFRPGAGARKGGGSEGSGASNAVCVTDPQGRDPSELRTVNRLRRGPGRAQPVV